MGLRPGARWGTTARCQAHDCLREVGPHWGRGYICTFTALARGSDRWPRPPVAAGTVSDKRGLCKMPPTQAQARVQRDP